MREKVLDSLHDLYVDEEMFSEGTEKTLSDIEEYVKGFMKNEDDNEEFENMLTWLMYYIFMDSANMVLDFISGKEIKKAPATDQSTQGAKE